MLAVVDVDPATCTFLDVGSGHGRALLLAADMGFRKVVGIELDSSMAAEGQRNIARWVQRHRATAVSGEYRIICQDGAEAAIPDEPLVVFLYDPFGRTTLKRLTERLVESQARSPRPMWLCYLNPAHAGVLDSLPQVVEQAGCEDWAVYVVEPGPRTEAGTARCS